MNKCTIRELEGRLLHQSTKWGGLAHWKSMLNILFFQHLKMSVNWKYAIISATKHDYKNITNLSIISYMITWGGRRMCCANFLNVESLLILKIKVQLETIGQVDYLAIKLILTSDSKFAFKTLNKILKNGICCIFDSTVTFKSNVNFK